jgi:hypothetical protein
MLEHTLTLVPPSLPARSVPSLALESIFFRPMPLTLSLRSFSNPSDRRSFLPLLARPLHHTPFRPQSTIQSP